MENLRDVLRSLRMESVSKAGRGFFFPTSALFEALTPARIHEVIKYIQDVKEHERNLLVSLILEKLPKIFCILSYDCNEGHFTDFLYHQEYDSRLPFTDEKTLYFLDGSVREKFMDRQWEFIPVLLKRYELHRRLRDREVLPFLEDEHLSSGGFGKVYRVKVCQSHQTLRERTGDDGELNIVRKQIEIKPNTDHERLVLELLRSIKHPNIVELLGSYTYHDDQNFLFPLADMNLQEFFRIKNLCSLETLYAGIFGLADALVYIHNFTFKEGDVTFSRIGYHHDLKPKNILVKGEAFLLADFGLSKLKAEDASSKTRFKGGDDDYLAPESFNYECLNNQVGRALDMWSFGCILAEFATYMKFGKGSIDMFREFRKITHQIGAIAMTDYAFHLNGSLRPQVTNWLSTLTHDPEDVHICRLVDLIRQMLRPAWRTRIQAQASSQRLAQLLFICRAASIQELMSMLLDRWNHDSPYPVLILLEQLRFVEWTGVYENIMKDAPSSLDIRVILSILEELQHDLRIAKQQLETVTCNYANSQPSSLHNSICQHIDSLRSKLPEAWKRTMDDNWVSSVTELDDSKMLDQIKAAEAPSRYRLVGIKAAMKRLCLAITHSKRTNGAGMLVEKGLVDLDRCSKNKFSVDGDEFCGDDAPETGTYDTASGPARVLVEWLGYNGGLTATHATQMYARLEALAKLLNLEETPRTDVLQHRILDCLGYFHDERSGRFGFIHKLQSSGLGEVGAPVNFYSLNYIIRSTGAMEDPRRPFLGDLFQFACAFVSCVDALHEVGWIHKRISSFSLLVFSETEDSALERIASCILSGFRDSRPEQSNYTMNTANELLLYQHPGYMSKTGYKRAYDYYSVGVVLLEIGLWIPVSKIWKEHTEILNRNHFRRLLLSSYVPRLGVKMGKEYMDAVTFCLEANDLTDLGERPQHRRLEDRSFRVYVVDKLANCFA